MEHKHGFFWFQVRKRYCNQCVSSTLALIVCYIPFVGVLGTDDATESELGVYEPHSIQLSDEAERLIRLQVIKPSKKDPTKFHVTRNNDQ